MKQDSSPRLAATLQKLSATASLFSITVGVSVICGWYGHLNILKSWIPGQVTMRVNTAACLMLLGAALWLSQKRREDQPVRLGRRLAAHALAGMILAVGLITLAEHVFHWNLGIDQWLFVVRAGDDVGAVRPGLMSLPSALSLALLATSILLLDSTGKRARRAAQAVCLAANLSTAIGLLDFILQTPISHTHISLPSAVTLHVVCWGVIFARPQVMFGGWLVRDSPGARWLRRSVPLILLVLALLGRLLSEPLLTTVHVTWAEACGIAAVVVFLLGTFVAWTAALLDQSDQVWKSATAVSQVGQKNLHRLVEQFEDSRVEVALRRWSAVAIGLGVVLAALGGFDSWQSMRRQAETARKVEHTHLVTAALETILAHAIDVETGDRGFAATGDETFLQAWSRGEENLDSDLDRLRSMIADNPSQKVRMDELCLRVAAKREVAQTLLARRRTTGRVPETSVFLQGKDRMDQLRATIAAMEAAERELLAGHTRAAEAARKKAGIVTVLVTLVAVTLLMFAAVVTRREIGRSVNMRGQIQALNSSLERRVEERAAALRDSEERFHAMVNGIPQLVWMAEADGHIFWYNQPWFEYTGTTLQEMEGWGWQSVHHPETLSAVSERWEDSLIDGTPFEMEFPLRGSDGIFRMFLTRVLPLKDSQGRVVRWFGTATDISQRKQMEDALRESEQRVRALMESTAEAILGNDLEGSCTFCNPAALRLLGYEDQSDLLGKNLRAVLHHSQADGTPLPADDGPLNQALRTGHSFHSDTLVLWRKDGTCFPAECWSHPVSSNGDLVGSVLTFFDISERKRAEDEIRSLNRELEERVQQRTAQLRESEQSVRRKLETILSPEGDLKNLNLADILDIPAIQALLEDFHSVFRVTTALLDLKGNVLIAVGWQDICVKFHRTNPDSCRNCVESDSQLSAGADAGEFKVYKCKNNMWDLATPIIVGDNRIGNLFCGQFFFADEAIDYELFRAQAREYGFNQEEYMAAVEAAPRVSRVEINAGMGFLARLAKMISQLSYSRIQLARSSAQLARVNAELAASNKELEAFTYSVSHDLRAPLRHINGFSNMLTEEFGPALPPPAQHYVERIAQGTRRMGLLVDDLLNLGRVGRQELRLQVTGLRSLVDETIAELQPECAGRQVEWKIGELPFVDCDPGLIKHVLQNLLSNALKFTRTRSPAVIEIGQQDDNGIPVVYVRDNGVGFSMKYADKLFGVFQRLHRQEDFEGTGVGLATVQRIIQKHKGRVWAEAELDRGAAFYFTLGAGERHFQIAESTSVGGHP